MTPRRVLSLILGLGLVAGCGSSQQAEEPAGEASGGGEDASTLRGHMSANFNLALTARDGVIAGSMIQAREAAVQLAEQDYSVLLPPNWMPGVERMQSAARELTGAEDVASAAGSVAELAAACGACHAERGLDLSSSHPSPARDFGEAEDMRERMQRHQRAADNFWYGLSVPSDGAWQQAAQMLLDAPMSPTDEEGKAVRQELASRVDAVRAIAQRALEAKGEQDRVQVYGELLSTCASCHQGGA